MKVPNDREWAELQQQAEQRRLLSGGRGFLIFFRIAVFVMLTVANVYVLFICWHYLHDPQGSNPYRAVGIIFALLVFDVFGLFFIRFASEQLADIKRHKEEAELTDEPNANTTLRRLS